MDLILSFLCTLSTIVAIIVVLIAVANHGHNEAQRRAREQQSLRYGLAEIDRMGGGEFERYLVGIFEGLGFRVLATKTTGDYGADLILTRPDGSKVAVQAKCYSKRVGNKAVQEVAAARDHYQCAQAIVVTNNYFTKAARTQAASSRVELWDRDRLIQAIEEARRRAYKPPTPSRVAPAKPPLPIDISCPACRRPIRTTAAEIGDLVCPHCSYKVIQSLN